MAPPLSPEIRGHYDEGQEQTRLDKGAGLLEKLRTLAVLHRHLGEAPARVLDVGGGAGVYAVELAMAGHDVWLVDPVPLHVDQATDAFAALPAGSRARASLGDARALAAEDASVDAVLLLGPLYHLIEREDRLRALREAARVVKPGGWVFAAGISRFASLLDGLKHDMLGDPAFAGIVRDDLATGVHQNPENRPGWFTTAYFHHPEALGAEVAEAGLTLDRVLGVEGPAWLLPGLDARLADPAARLVVIDALARVEAEPALLGASAHLLAVARR